MIGVDWGTTSLRAFRIGSTGAVRARRELKRGILNVENGRFAEMLREVVGDWIADGETRILLSGMIGSRQGWQEAPYLPCPASAADLAGAVERVRFDGAEVRLVPGVSARDEAGVPEVMRGEETQIVGALGDLRGNAIACLPGTHSKWVTVEDGRITGFTTHMTGESFAALRGHTILGRMMRDGSTDPAAFARGVARAADPGGLLHHLFGVRALGLFGELADDAAASYLSGLLIGHEVRAAMRSGMAVHLIGAPELCALYERAIKQCGGTGHLRDQDAAARGLALIGERIAWS